MSYRHRYVRHPKTNAKVGVVTAEWIEGKVFVGWSRCCSGDRFDRDMALRIALGRGRNWHKRLSCGQPPRKNPPSVPDDVMEVMEDVIYHMSSFSTVQIAPHRRTRNSCA